MQARYVQAWITISGSGDLVISINATTMPSRSSTGIATRSTRSGFSVWVCNAAPLSPNYLLVVSCVANGMLVMLNIMCLRAICKPATRDWLFIFKSEIHFSPDGAEVFIAAKAFRGCDMELLTCVKVLEKQAKKDQTRLNKSGSTVRVDTCAFDRESAN